MSKASEREARFFSKVKKTRSCWLWQAATATGGHGMFWWCTKATSAHRVSWIIHNGPVPRLCKVLHNCPGGDNPACVNPAHLWLGTNKDNSQDMAKKNRAASVLTPRQVRQIKRRLRNNPQANYSEIARCYHVHRVTIHNIAEGNTWKHIS